VAKDSSTFINFAAILLKKMGRGGAYFLSGFIAGSVAAYCMKQLFGLAVNPIFPLSAATIATILYIITLQLGFVHRRPRLLVILPLLSLFFCGFANMGRTALPPQSENAQKEFQNGVVHEISEIIENFTIKKISGILEGPKEKGVAIAFITGEKGHIPRNLKEAYRQSGAMHVLALSGLHIGIIYAILNLIFSFLDMHIRSRRVKFAICTLFIFMYAAITGFGASVQRAAIMVTVWKLLSMSRRDGGRWSVLLLSACIILLINPNELADIGFQLSFAAMAGIIGISPTLCESIKIFGRYGACRFLRAVWNLICISTACQIATAPLVLYYFDSFPFFFLITNIAAIPLVTISLYILVFSLITCNIPIIGNLSGSILQITLKILNWIIEYIGI